MKTLLTILTAAIIMFALPTALQGQIKEQQKERQQVEKAAKKEFNKKAEKAARNEAKHLKKEGWTVTPGTLPLEKQIDRAYLMQYEYDDNYMPKYLMAEAMSVGGNYDGARVQAMELAKMNLATQVQSEITALVENTVANDQLSAGEAESVTRSIMASKNIISQSLGRVLPVVEAYRTLDNGNKEVLVRIAYNADLAMQAAKKAVRQDLEQRGDNLHTKLDTLMGW